MTQPKPRIGSTIEIVRNYRGGWGLRLSGDWEILGNYATPADARRHADPTFEHVVVIDEEERGARSEERAIHRSVPSAPTHRPL